MENADGQKSKKKFKQENSNLRVQRKKNMQKTYFL